MRVAIPATVLAFLALAPSAARSQDRDPIVADTLLREGRTAVAKGDFAAACPKIADSYRLDPLPAAIFELADCEERLGRLAAAWLDYRKAVDVLAPNDARLEVAKQKAAALEKRVARLTIRLGPGVPPGTIVRRDGVAIGSSAVGVAIPADPGTHVVVVGEGAHARRYEVTLGEGESRDLVGDLASVAPPAERPSLLSRPPAMASVSPEAEAHRAFSGEEVSASGARTFGYVVGGVGVASLAVGVVTRVMALGKKSTIDEHCNAAKVCADVAGMDAVSSAQDLQTASTVTLAIGVGAVATGALLVLLNPDKPAQPALQPTILAGGAGLTFTRRF